MDSFGVLHSIPVTSINFRFISFNFFSCSRSWWTGQFLFRSSSNRPRYGGRWRSPTSLWCFQPEDDSVLLDTEWETSYK